MHLNSKPTGILMLNLNHTILIVENFGCRQSNIRQFACLRQMLF